MLSRTVTPVYDQRPASSQRPASDQQPASDQPPPSTQRPASSQRPALDQRPASSQPPASDQPPASTQPPESDSDSALSSDLEQIKDDDDLDKRERFVHKWNELFKETMSPTAFKLGVKSIKNSRIHGPSYAKVQAACRAFFNSDLHTYNSTDRAKVKAATQLFKSWTTTAVNRYRAALNRSQRAL